MRAICFIVERRLTAWIDGEVHGRSGRLIARHLAHCTLCRRVEQELRAAARAGAEALRVAVPPAGVDEERAWRRLRGALAEAEAAAAAPRWRPRLLWVGAAGALTAAAAALYLSDFGIALGLREPPPAVQRYPELFRDYAFFEQLELPEEIPGGRGEKSSTLPRRDRQGGTAG